MKRIFVIEGLDRTGKDTLIDGIEQKCGYYQHIHFSKPKKLKAYDNIASIENIPAGQESTYIYQYQSFLNAMLLINGGARIIFNRSWIGEAVYSPLYRNFSGDYVYNLEKNINDISAIRLILLVEDFEKSYHFVDDGQSLGPAEKRQQEQKLFIEAFKKSNIVDKRIIEVTAPDGSFRSKESILFDALKD